MYHPFNETLCADVQKYPLILFFIACDNLSNLLLQIESDFFCKDVVRVCLLIIESTPFKLNFHVTEEDLFVF